MGQQPIEAVAAQLDLFNAKQHGLVGETPEGLIGVVDPPGDQDIQTLIQSVNKGRLESYREIAESRGLSLAEVQKLAGKNLIERTPSGQYVMTREGQWMKKADPGSP